jgi:TonB-linked SusC/RagA family outer membrane protein
MKKLLQSLFVLMFFAVSAMAQQRTITGTVTGNDDGLPLPGVSVKVKGAAGGASTDLNGKFSVVVPAEGTSLEFSSVGYVPQTKAIADLTVINMSLVPDSRTLGEVVVTANAIKREKRTLGYSAPTIKSSELTEGGSSSVLSSLSGKVAGVNITSTSGAPGSSSRVVLRGGSSISGSNQALIVVDGVPIDNSSVTGGASSLSSVDFGNRGNDLSPDDIASVTVLKGPAAAALYGSRASNGALIITTKTGTKGAEKTSITFNSNNTFSSVLKLPELQNEYGQGYYDKILPGGKTATYITDLKENWSWGAPFTGNVQEWGQMIDGVRQMKPYSAAEHQVKDFFSTGFATDNNLSLSGGGDKTSFYLAINSLNSNGIYPGDSDEYNKYGVRFNGTADLGNKFTTGVSFNFSKIDANQVGGGQGNASVYNNVLQTPRDINIKSIADLNNPYNSYGYTNAAGVSIPGSYGYYGAYTQNPYWILDNYSNLNDVSRVTGNFNIGYKPTDWLNVTERVGVDTFTDRRRTLSPKFNFVDIDQTDEYAGVNRRTSNGEYRIDQYNVTELVHDLMVTATHKFNEDFEGSLMLGNNIRQRQTNTLSSATNASGGLVVPGWYNLGNSNGPVNVISDLLSKRRLIGLYADLNLSYKNFLFLQATARNDWSSTLPAQNNSFFYPSVSGSFVFSELLKSSSVSDVLTYGKIRSSWAQVGNDTDPYQLLATFNKATVNGNFGSTVFPFGNVAALAAGSSLGNLDLKPEKTTSFEVGAELGFFQNRFAVDFSYYNNNSKNQILSIPIPNSTGYGFSIVNAGEVQNKGVELSLRGTPVQTGNVTWEVYGSFTKNNNEVVSLLPGVDQISLGGFSGMSIVAAVGKPYGEFYAVTEAKDAEGRTIVDAETGIPVNSSTAQYLGNYNPDWQASLGTSFKFKQITLGVLFDTKQGGEFFSRTKDILAFNGTSAETGGERIGTIFPNSVYLDANGNSVVNTTVGYNKQDYFTARPAGVNIVDGSYVKLRSANISYTFTKDQLRRSPFGALTLGVYGNNLFMWTAAENDFADPEVNSAGAGNVQGFDYSAQPSVRNYGINVKVSF